MTMVGHKDIFAIEWSHYSVTDDGLLCGDISYIANNQPIESEGGIINWAVNGVKGYLSGYGLNDDGAYRNIPVDFSDVPKEEVYYRIWFSSYGDDPDVYTICPNQYREFYAQCKKLMITAYHAGKMPFCSRKEMEASIAMGDDFSEDYLLGGWIHGKFEISNITGDALDNYHIYLVRDIAKNQERLIWRHYSDYNEETDSYHHFPIFEAILPIGYFAKVQAKFVEVASEEIERIKNGEEYVDSGWIVV